MDSIIIHFCFCFDAPVGSTLLVGCGPTVIVEVEVETLIVGWVVDDVLLVCGSTVVVLVELLDSRKWRGEVRAIYSTTFTISSCYIPKIHPASSISEQQSPNW